MRVVSVLFAQNVFPFSIAILIVLNNIPTHCAAAGQSEIKARPTVPAEMQFEPAWREKSDCGPCALYVLLRLEGHSSTLDDVKRAVRVDPDSGCSLAELAQASSALGLPVEIRFVAPKELPKMPCPYIVHLSGSLKSGIGHFAIITEYSAKDRRFHYVDSEFDECRTMSEHAILRSHSGYVMVAVRQTYSQITKITSMGLLFAAAFIWMKRRKNGSEKDHPSVRFASNVAVTGGGQ